MESDIEKLIKLIKKNKDETLDIFNEYYNGKAQEMGEEWMYDERFVQEEELDDWIGQEGELYESFAHCDGYSASYEGAYGVIKYLVEEHNLSCDPNDEELQIEVMNALDVSPY